MDYIQDPGHGWFKVKLTQLSALGIENDISTYSYQRGEWAYLEEDCDASKYFDALKLTGQPMPKIVDKVSRERPSKIRSYDRYITPQAKWNKFVKDHFVVISVGESK
jgi:hypothetical protein